MQRREFGKNMAIYTLGATIIPNILLAKKKEKMAVTIGDSAETFADAANLKGFQTNPVFIIANEHESEVLVLDAALDFVTKAPAKTTDGFRFMELAVGSWKGSAESKLLGKTITFEVTRSYKSEVKSKYLNQDFPSNIEMNLEYNVYLGSELVVKGASAAVNADINTLTPDPTNLFMVKSENVNIGPGNKYDLIFCAA